MAFLLITPKQDDHQIKIITCLADSLKASCRLTMRLEQTRKASLLNRIVRRH
jgi:hypothetical protein